MSDLRNSEWVIEKREARASGSMVTAMHPLAASAGLEILRAGGNAVDAAVATAFAVGVVEPFMSGVGGVAVMVYYQAATGRTVVVDGSSTAPQAAREEQFELAPHSEKAGLYGWRRTIGDAQNTGFRSPITPGMPACLLHSLETYGSGQLNRRQVMMPAIRLAEEGFAVDPYVASTTAFAMRRLRAFPETMRTYFHPDGTPLAPASLAREPDRLVQPDLARTLQLLAEHGSDIFYQGEIGERIVADLQANGGLLTLKDLASYRVRELEPLRVEYRGHTLMGVPLTSGCVTAYQALQILEHFDLRSLGRSTFATTHVIVEALRRAFLDRFGYLADPEYVDVPFHGILSKVYASHLASRISHERADPDACAGDPWSYQMSGRSEVGRLGIPSGDGCTTHLTVVDRARNVVTLTSTLGELFGCGVVPRGTGVLLNNGMTWFNPEPGTANSIAPGKRILWAPTPTIVFENGQPVVALGAPGGRRIISAVVQSIVNLLDHEMGVQEALTAPRVHCEGSTTEVEARVDSAVRSALGNRGHRLKVIEETGSSFSFARPNGIRIDPLTGELSGGVNQFTPAWAFGY